MSELVVQAHAQPWVLGQFYRCKHGDGFGPWHFLPAEMTVGLCGVHRPDRSRGDESVGVVFWSEILDFRYEHEKTCGRCSVAISRHIQGLSDAIGNEHSSEAALGSLRSWSGLVDSARGQDGPPFFDVVSATHMRIVHYRSSGLSFIDRLRANREPVPPAMLTYEQDGMGERIEEVFKLDGYDWNAD